MLKKVVVFDCGIGGELFADYIENELAIIDVIRVIDWRHSPSDYKSPHFVRKTVAEILRPYLNQVDVIVFANLFISLTCLDYFIHKYPSQKFSGFSFSTPPASRGRRILILSTKSLHALPAYHLYKYRLRAKTSEFDCDEWLNLLSHGRLTLEHLKNDLIAATSQFKPQQLYFTSTHLAKIKPMFRHVFGPTIKMEDGFLKAYRDLCDQLGLRGAKAGKRK
jgi:glutamate racemase